jgi:hypothetical protein
MGARALHGKPLLDCQDNRRRGLLYSDSTSVPSLSLPLNSTLFPSQTRILHCTYGCPSDKRFNGSSRGGNTVYCTVIPDPTKKYGEVEWGEGASVASFTITINRQSFPYRSSAATGNSTALHSSSRSRGIVQIIPAAVQHTAQMPDMR